MSVQVDAVSGVGTAIQSGDYVDLIIGLTGDAFPVVQLNPQDNSIQVVAGLNSTSVKVLLEGMQVLATVQPETKTSGNQPTPNPSASPTPNGPDLTQDSTELVILSVTAQQAEVIKFAQLQGSISLVLRSPKDFFDENGQPVLPLPRRHDRRDPEDPRRRRLRRPSPGARRGDPPGPVIRSTL